MTNPVKDFHSTTSSGPNSQFQKPPWSSKYPTVTTQGVPMYIKAAILGSRIIENTAVSAMILRVHAKCLSFIPCWRTRLACFPCSAIADICIFVRSAEACKLCPQIDMTPPRIVENNKVIISKGNPNILLLCHIFCCCFSYNQVRRFCLTLYFLMYFCNKFHIITETISILRIRILFFIL